MGQGARNSRASGSQGAADGPVTQGVPASQEAAAPQDLDTLLATAAATAAAAAAARQPPAAFSHAVPHFQQVHNWDCGLACVLMVLRALGMQQHSMATLLQMCPTRSVWTIDLAHLLAACGARVQMLTVTIGANQAYARERFYADSMGADSQRVEALFQSAAAAGVAVHQRSLPLADLKALLLSGRCLPVMLVDKGTLNGGGAAAIAATAAAAAAAAAACPASTQPPQQQASQRQEGSQQQQEQQRAGGVPMPPAARTCGLPSRAAAAAAGAAGAAAEAAGAGYLGHYILLCGYDAAADAFEYRDPSADRACCWAPAPLLDAARLQFGTDEDVLLVEVPPAPPASSGQH